MDLERLRRRGSARTLGVFLGLFAAACSGKPLAVAPRVQVSHDAAPAGRPVHSTAVPAGGDSLVVAVVSSGADPSKPAVRIGDRPVAVTVAGYDPVSRLQFLRLPDDVALTPVQWLKESAVGTGLSLVAMTPEGPCQSRTSGWVKQVNGKILPLSLLRVNFGRAVPPPGTPLMDEAGRVAAIIFQDSGSGNTGYALPAEAVLRVKRDLFSEGRLVRGWLGLALRADSLAPQIVRVLPNSPAAAAGVQPGDVLVAIGPRQIADYADAANAFFYLVPGQPVQVQLLRGDQQKELVLTPARPQE